MPTPNERLSQYRQQTEEMPPEETTGRVRAAVECTEDMVRRNPASSALVTFGIGFGLGLILTELLTPAPPRRSWFQAYMPERFSKKQISDAISSMLPDAIARYMAR